MKKLLLSLGALSAVIAPIAVVVACGSTDSKDSATTAKPEQTNPTRTSDIAKIKAKLSDEFKNAPAEQKELLNSKLDAATDVRIAQLERDLASSDGEQEIGDVINSFLGIKPEGVDGTSNRTKASNIEKIKAKLGDEFENAPAEQKELLNSKLDAATDTRVAQLERDLASSDGEQEIGDVINGFLGINPGEIDESTNQNGQGSSEQLGTIVENGGAATAITSFSLEDLLKSKGYTMSGGDETESIFDQLLAHTTEGANVNFHLGKTTSGKASISNKHVENHEKGGILRHNGNDFLIVINGGTQADTTQALITSDKLAELSSTDVKFIEQWGDLGDAAFADATSIIYLHNNDNGGIKVTVNQVFKFNGKVYEATQDGKGVKTLQAKYAAPTA